MTTKIASQTTITTVTTTEFDTNPAYVPKKENVVKRVTNNKKSQSYFWSGENKLNDSNVQKESKMAIVQNSKVINGENGTDNLEITIHNSSLRRSDRSKSISLFRRLSSLQNDRSKSISINHQSFSSLKTHHSKRASSYSKRDSSTSHKNLIRIVMPEEMFCGHQIHRVRSQCTYGDLVKKSISKFNKSKSNKKLVDSSHYVMYCSKVGKHMENTSVCRLSMHPRIDNVCTLKMIQVKHTRLDISTDGIENLGELDLSNIGKSLVNKEKKMPTISPSLTTSQSHPHTERNWNPPSLQKFPTFHSKSNRVSHIVVLDLKIISANLPKMDMFGLCDPFVKVIAQTSNGIYLTQRTSTLNKTIQPVWNESLHFIGIGLEKIIKIEVYDYDKYNNVPIAHCILKLNHHVLEQVQKPKKFSGEITLIPKCTSNENNFTIKYQACLTKIIDSTSEMRRDSQLIIATRKSCNLETIRNLMDSKANINQAAKSGATALSIASEKGDILICRELILAKADMNEAMTDGATPLYMASQNGHTDIVRYLIQSNANLDRVDDNGSSSLYIACQNQHNEIVDQLIKAKANVDKPYTGGYTPLYTASRYGYNIIVKKLIEAKSSLERSTRTGATPLKIACENGHLVVVRQLLNAAADANKCTKNGASPLYVAIYTGNFDIVKQLITVVAEINNIFPDNNTPLSLAYETKKQDIIDLLLNAKCTVEHSHTDQKLKVKRIKKKRNSRKVTRRKSQIKSDQVSSPTPHT